MLSNSIGKARGAEVGLHAWSQNANILYVFRLQHRRKFLVLGLKVNAMTE